VFLSPFLKGGLSTDIGEFLEEIHRNLWVTTVADIPNPKISLKKGFVSQATVRPGNIYPVWPRRSNSDVESICDIVDVFLTSR